MRSDFDYVHALHFVVLFYSKMLGVRKVLDLGNLFDYFSGVLFIY